MNGAFVFSWAAYTYPFEDDPESNLDTAGYGIVAVRDGNWRPKEAFTAIERRWQSNEGG